MKPRKRMSLAKRLPLWLAIAALALFAAGSAAQAQSDAPFLPNSSPDATVTMEAESYATNTAVGGNVVGRPGLEIDVVVVHRAIGPPDGLAGLRVDGYNLMRIGPRDVGAASHDGRRADWALDDGVLAPVMKDGADRRLGDHGDLRLTGEPCRPNLIELLRPRRGRAAAAPLIAPVERPIAFI